MNPRRPHFADSVFALMVAVLLLVLEGALFEAWGIAGMAVGSVLWVPAFWLYGRAAGLDPIEAFSLRLPPPGALPWLLILWFSAWWLLTGLEHAQAAWFDWMGLSFREEIGRYFQGVRTIREAGPIVAATLLCIVSPIKEEALFRGLLLSGLVRSFTPLRGVLYSAAWFGALHLALPRMGILFLVGLLFGFAVVRTRSLAAGILLHILHNTAALVLEPLASRAPHPAVLAVAACAFVWGFRDFLRATRVSA